jgi:hypothetical protein
MTEQEITELLAIIEQKLREDIESCERVIIEGHHYKVTFRIDENGKNEIIIKQR